MTSNIDDNDDAGSDDSYENFIEAEILKFDSDRFDSFHGSLATAALRLLHWVQNIRNFS